MRPEQAERQLAGRAARLIEQGSKSGPDRRADAGAPEKGVGAAVEENVGASVQIGREKMLLMPPPLP